MKNTVKVVLKILVGVIFLIWGKYYADDNIRPELHKMAILDTSICTGYLLG